VCVSKLTPPPSVGQRGHWNEYEMLLHAAKANIHTTSHIIVLPFASSGGSLMS
jgi:hypothetical protein